MKPLTSNIIDYKDILFKWLSDEDKIEHGEKLQEWYINELQHQNSLEEII